MNSPVFALRLASAIFALIGLGHVIRILAHAELLVGSCSIGRRWSVLAVLVMAVLCGWFWKIASNAAKKPEVAPPKPTA
jgi:hypothetical protein